MENTDIEVKLSLNLKELSENESNKLLLWATIYERTCYDIIDKKTKEFEEYLEYQAKAYKVNVDNYKEKFNELVSEYNSKIRRVFAQYNAQYIYIQNETVLAQSNQKIAIANLIASKRNELKALNVKNDVLVQKSRKKIFATAQKKLNYDVVIDECMARLENCQKNTIHSLNEIFTIKNNQIAKNNNSIIAKIKRLFKFSFGGEKNFNKYVIKQLESNFKDIEAKTVLKVADVKIQLMTYISQMEKIRNDINLVFNETLNKV